MKIQAGHFVLFLLLAAASCHEVPDMSSFGETVQEHKCIHHLLTKQYPPQLSEFHEADPHQHAATFFNGGEGSHSMQFTPSHLGAYDSPDNAPDGWHGIRIYLDFSFADTFTANADAALKGKYQMSARITQSVKRYFQSVLQVNYYQKHNFNGGKCYNHNIAAFSKYIDLYIVISPENDSGTNYFAAALACYLSPRDRRPTMGAYILNFAFLKDLPINNYLYFSTFAHEFTHILGFSNDLFGYYTDLKTGAKLTNVVGQSTIGGLKSSTYNIITIPDVVNYARSYFNCPTLPGVPLENEGGEGTAGSHWEKTFLPHEYMNPTTANPGIISEFTFSLLRGSGWYRTMTGGSQRFDWGQGSGCGYFNHCPPSHQGTCTDSQVGFATCSADYDAKALCIKDSSYGTGCPRKSPQEHSCFINKGDKPLLKNEEYGPLSRCFVWTMNNVTPANFPEPRCHLTFCDSTGALLIKYGSSVVKCTKSGEVITSLETTHKLVCPDIQDFCGEANARCPDDCNAKGVCTASRTCICYHGFTGESCSQTSTTAQLFAP